MAEKSPFDDNFFDIVISNHVIEHIASQQQHLSEIKRVLKHPGICYFATPNWYFPIEPHYKIPLIHYLPHKIFHTILKRLKLYKEELFLLSYNEMLNLFRKNNFESFSYSSTILKFPEKFFLEITLFKRLPLTLLNWLSYGSPTSIFMLINK